MQIAFILALLALVASTPAIFFFVMMVSLPARWTMLVLLGMFVFCTIGYTAMGLANLGDDQFGVASFANMCFWVSMVAALLFGGVISLTRPSNPRFRQEPAPPSGRFVNGGTVFAAALSVVLPIYPMYFGSFLPHLETSLLITLGVIAAVSLVGFLMTNRFNGNDELSGLKVFWATSPVAWAALIALSLHPPAIAVPSMAEEKSATVAEPTCEEGITYAEFDKSPRSPDETPGGKLPRPAAFGDLQKAINAERRPNPDCVSD